MDRCSLRLTSGLPAASFLLLIALLFPSFASASANEADAALPEPAPECSLAPDAPPLTISGSVADPSGARVADASISASCGSFRREARSDENGVFSLTLPAGPYRLRVEAAKFAVENRDITVSTENAARELNFALRVAQIRSSVSVTADAGYATSVSSGATKTEIPLLEVPQSITVVNRQLLDDQGAVKVDDALKNVAGVMPGGYYDGWDYYRIRGFDASFTTYIDGLRSGNGMQEETFGLESIEILKGPSSALYGQGVLGGLINLRTKRPVPAAFAKVQLTGGSFGFLDPGVDLGGSLNSSHTLFARVTALFHHQDNYVNYAYRNRYYIAPALTWDITPSTSLTLLSHFQRDNGRQSFPLPAAGTVLPNSNGEIPIDTYVGELTENANEAGEKNRQFGYELVHHFNDSFAFHQNARFSWYDQAWNKVLYPAMLADDQRTLYRYPLNWVGDWKTYEVDSNFDAHFKTGALRHNALFGVDFYRRPDTSLGESIDFSDMTQYMPIDIFNPVYGTTPFPTLSPYYSGKTRVQFTGIYLQDQIQLLRRLSLTLGGRVDFASNFTQGDDTQKNTAFTPRVGLTYDLVPGAALYASYSKSFLPQSGRVYDGSDNGAFVSPERGEQWEGGLKTSLLSGRLATTLAIYQLKRRNVITDDPDHPNFYVLTGEQRSRGVELENTLRLLPGWNLNVAYAFTSAQVTDDNLIPIGTPTQNAPRNTINIWSTYEIQKGWARGLGFGGGGRHYTDQSGDLYDTFRIPGYGLIDASVFYRHQRLSWQLNLYNLANKRYFLGSYDNLYVKPGAPRELRSTISWTF